MAGQCHLWQWRARTCYAFVASTLLPPAQIQVEHGSQFHAFIFVIWLLQAEYCFTVEGNDKSPALISLRGLDAALFYRSGSSLLDLGHPVVTNLVLDSMRHWVTEYGLDGFALLSAEAMAQDSGGFVLDSPPIAQALSAGVQSAGPCSLIGCVVRTTTSSSSLFCSCHLSALCCVVAAVFPGSVVDCVVAFELS